MRKFEYFAPQSLQEAIDLLRQRGDGGRPLAGGTDLVAQMREGTLKFPFPSYLVSLRRIPELKGIEFSEGEGLRIGAGVTMAELAASPIIRERFPIIADGAGLVGSIQTMNMATVGATCATLPPRRTQRRRSWPARPRRSSRGPQGDAPCPWRSSSWALVALSWPPLSC